MHDLVIRIGTIIDGTGKPARLGDVVIDGACISAVGTNLMSARREIDATDSSSAARLGRCPDSLRRTSYLVSISHSVVMPRCDNDSFWQLWVGFATNRPGSEGYLINLMQGAPA